jgi:hypothetical protein
MKTRLALLALVSAYSLQPSSLLHAASTIDAANRYAYAANLGWVDGRGDAANGAVIGDYVCSGNLYAANAGWINLGSGSPTNGIRYQNLAGSDFGVNHDGLGNLRGYAWGANIGWINFESTGAPTVSLKTGNLSGYVYSANCGWISLSNAFAHMQIDSFDPGALAPDGLPIAWLLSNFSTTNVNANADLDHDGVPNSQEYLAGTDPNDGTDRLAITTYSTTPGGTLVTVTWKSQPTRSYFVQQTLDLSSPSWFDSGLGRIAPDGASTTRSFGDTNAPMRFYRVRAVRPLAP